MPGTFVFKPIEANISHNTEWFGKMDPYCSFLVGEKRINGEVCKKGGKHPHWNDSITVPAASQSKLTVEILDKDKIGSDDQIGSFIVDLKEIESQGQVNKWYPFYHKNKPAGEILLQSSFQGGNLAGGNLAGGSLLAGGAMLNQPGSLTSETKTINQTEFLNQSGLSAKDTLNRASANSSFEGKRTFIEQRQSVEPRTFNKEVDVVETRPVVKQIEVLEPHKVMKEVQYTEAVPVKKQIEVIEPHVVTKEVEVIEPRLVTKQIQVIENVPVKKQVEVIESIPILKEIDTFEPQTFTKTVEVTEQVPVLKQVTVTEPVTLKKNVEFIEPIITTQIITKEIQPAVIVDEKVTREVGPASVVHISSEVREAGYLGKETRYSTGQLSGSSIQQNQIGTQQITSSALQQNLGNQQFASSSLQNLGNQELASSSFQKNLGNQQMGSSSLKQEGLLAGQQANYQQKGLAGEQLGDNAFLRKERQSLEKKFK